MAPAQCSWSRLGVVVSKHAAKRAHDRNQVKRRLREWFRLGRHKFTKPVDLLALAKPGAQNLSADDLSKELAGALSQWLDG